MIVTFYTAAYDKAVYHPPNISKREINKRSWQGNYTGLVQGEEGDEGMLQIEVPDTGTYVIKVQQTQRYRSGKKHYPFVAKYATVHNGAFVNRPHEDAVWTNWEHAGAQILEEFDKQNLSKEISNLESQLLYHRTEVRSLANTLRQYKRQRGY